MTSSFFLGPLVGFGVRTLQPSPGTSGLVDNVLRWIAYFDERLPKLPACTFFVLVITSGPCGYSNPSLTVEASRDSPQDEVQLASSTGVRMQMYQTRGRLSWLISTDKTLELDCTRRSPARVTRGTTGRSQLNQMALRLIDGR